MKKLISTFILLTIPTLYNVNSVVYAEEITEQMALDRQVDAEGEVSGCIDVGGEVVDQGQINVQLAFLAATMRAALKAEFNVPDEELIEGDTLYDTGQAWQSITNTHYTNEYLPWKNLAEQLLATGNDYLEDEEWALAYWSYDAAIDAADYGISAATTALTYANNAWYSIDQAYNWYNALYEALSGDPA